MTYSPSCISGTDHLKARKIYRALVSHHKRASCPICNSYPKYGSLIINGDLFEHIGDIAGFKIDVSDFFKLRKAGLIELDEITPARHRIIFVKLVREEETSPEEVQV